MKKLLLLALLLVGNFAMAQSGKTITGQVTDSEGFELIGVTVMVEGTSKGEVTDVYGNYSLKNVSAEDVLIFSYAGYASQEITVGTQSVINVQLQTDVTQLEEVVVIGYGTSKAKDLTSPIATVTGDQITAMNTSSPMSAIQGKVAGVSITNSGAPGSGPSVSIRGVGSLQNSSPLYVVDGMFLDDINFLNPNDIQTMSILKDASAASIYGVRAANGVVLITTKSGGKNRKPVVTYDGYYGVQSVTNTLEMANGEQYSSFMRASGDADYISRIDQSIALWGGENGIPTTSTDWYSELLKNNSPIQSHNISVNGGTDNSTYAFSFGYFSQEGMMNSTGNYERYNFRADVDVDLTDKVKIGFSSILSVEDRQIDDNSAWFSAYTNNPIYPVYDETLADDQAYPVKFASPNQIGYDTYYTNPMAVMYYGANSASQVYRFIPNLFLEYRPFENKDITFRSSMNMDIAYGTSTSYNPSKILGGNATEFNSLSKSNNTNADYIWDNTITWREHMGDHNLTSMIGFSVREENYRWMTGTASDLANNDYLSTGNAETRSVNDGGSVFKGMSAFARLSYDFKHKYLLSATLRADGSSKYQEKWGIFPSVGAGWVITEEDFAEGLKDGGIINHIKLRASWGMLGNDRVPANDGFASVSLGGLGESGIYNGILVPGMTNNTVYSDLAWEVVHETNVGAEFRLFDNRLSLETDYYIKDTENMVVLATMPMGNGSVLRNSGSVRNSGIEVTANWSDNLGEDFSYSIGGNITTIKNEVTSLSGEPYLQTGTAEFPQRSIVGEPIYSFYGWEVEGVYQTQAEVDACEIAQANGLTMGDFKYADTNGDGVISTDDRVLLGDPNPDFIYGFNVAANYKGWGLSATFQGVSGVSIFNRKRADINKHGSNNIDANLYNALWNGEGSTNDTPSAAGMFNPWNTGRLNSFFIEDGSYFRIQNIRLSYDFPREMLSQEGTIGLQLYVNADRPFTFYNTNGFTPEVAGGIDQQVYPIPAVFTLGARFTF